MSTLLQTCSVSFGLLSKLFQNLCQYLCVTVKQDKPNNIQWTKWQAKIIFASNLCCKNLPKMSNGWLLFCTLCFVSAVILFLTTGLILVLFHVILLSHWSQCQSNLFLVSTRLVGSLQWKNPQDLIRPSKKYQP